MFTLYVSVPWISISILEISLVVVVHLVKFCTIIQGMRKTSFESLSLVNDGTICMEDTEQQFDGSMPYFSVVTWTDCVLPCLLSYFFGQSQK